MKYIIILLLIVSSTCYGQMVSYDFENNLIDNISGFDGTYTVNGNISNTTPVYTTGQSGSGIFLDPTQGIYLPMSLNNQLDFDKSIEFVFDFKITTLGSDDGRKEILELSAGWNDNTTGINVWTDKIDDNNYKVILNYTDGGYNEGVENHPGGSRNNIGTFDVGEFVKFRLILDFEKNKWTTILNNTSSSAYFDSYYDLDKIKQVVKNNYIRIGWLNASQSWVMANRPDIFTSSMILDNLKIYSPKSNTLLSELTTALNAMTNHVNGSSTLSESLLQKYLTDIQLNYSGNFTDAKSDIFEFLNAYEDKYEPVFSDGNEAVFSELPVEIQTLIFLQQAIFDEEYKSNAEEMEGIKFEFSEVFPGKVSASAQRVNDAPVEIDGTYNVIHGTRHLHDTWDAKRPTGHYAPPGELITITIPTNHVDKGMSVMIGAHERDHSNLSQTNRFLRISNRFGLSTEETKIVNPFGGGIYILVPEGSNFGYFDITINGAVKSPYFSTREGKGTDLSVWQDELAEQSVKWVDIESDKFMTTLPIDVIDGISPGSINLTDPRLMMEKWDEVADGFNYVGGRPQERSRAEYIISDTRIPDGGYGTGYPAVYDDDDKGMMLIALLENEPHKIGGVRTMFHEMGHLEWHPTLGNATESIVHLPAVYIWNKYYDLPLDTAFKYSAFQNLTMDQTTIDWIITDNFRNNIGISCDPTMNPSVCHEVRYQHRGHAMYIEIADLFGWEAVHNTHKVFYNEWKVNTQKDWGFMGLNNGNRISDDELILAASNANNVNMAPLFHFWGRQPSLGLVDQLKDLPLSNEILCQLLDYKKLIPNNSSEFQYWYDANYISVGGVQQVRYDYALNNYDNDNYNSDMQNQIDLILNTYYGEDYEYTDSDDDSIEDVCDQCPDTPTGEAVDAGGCSDSQKDTDGDGVTDDIDECPSTPTGETVDANGCSNSQKDTDGDGVTDDIDQCPSTPTGETVDASGCSNSQKDSDGDGINDPDDICPLVSNIDQLDTDEDGIGDACDNCSTVENGHSIVGTTVAGGNGAGSAANQLDNPYDIALDASGNLYIADYSNHRIQKWIPGASEGTTVAGGNGQGSSATQLSNPRSITLDASGNLYIADKDNHRIQKWSPGASEGTTVAGGNGQGSAANQLNQPSEVFLDSDVNLYISDTYNHRIQKWAPGATEGVTVAGGNGQGSAANQFHYSTGIALDASGNMYIADLGNHRIQKWAPGATEGTTVAGLNGYGSAANQLVYPNRITLDASGNLYISDSYNNRIQKWAPGATEGVTVAGGNGEGSASNQLDYPRGIKLDSLGKMYIADRGDHRIQKWALGQWDTDGDGIGDACDPSNIDTDNDGVTDDVDECPSTPTGEAVDAAGCSDSQKDTDNDGVTDDVDECPSTPTGETVDASGCTLPLFVENISFIKRIYPNPTDNELLVELKENSIVKKVEFVDFSGKQIKPNKVEISKSSIRINVSNLNNGIYILNLTTDKEVNKVKVVIER